MMPQLLLWYPNYYYYCDYDAPIIMMIIMMIMPQCANQWNNNKTIIQQRPE